MGVGAFMQQVVKILEIIERTSIRGGFFNN
jgi:hypothetical protein